MAEKIFIHIPKTGGTTLDCTIKGTKWMSNSDPFTYRHIVHEKRQSNAGDIFQPAKHDIYKDHLIYTMMRHPVDRFISEYYFLRDRKEYFGLLKGKPRNLKAYAQHPQTRNSILNFLNGGRMYPTKPVKKKDLARIIERIENLPIHVAIFEHYEASLTMIEKVLKKRLPKHVEARRITLNRPSYDEISEEVKQEIEKYNQLDMELYNYCLEKFQARAYEPKKVSMTKDPYGYVMKYSERFNLNTLYQTNSRFESRNNKALRDMNLWLHHQIPTEKGKTYVASWNANLLAMINQNYQNEELESIASQDITDDPLQLTKQIIKHIDKLEKSDKNFSRHFLQFDPDQGIIVKEKKEKKSFFKSLFGN